MLHSLCCQSCYNEWAFAAVELSGVGVSVEDAASADPEGAVVNCCSECI